MSQKGLDEESDIDKKSFKGFDSENYLLSDNNGKKDKNTSKKSKIIIMTFIKKKKNRCKIKNSTKKNNSK